MKELIISYFPWILSVITIYQIMLAGDKRPTAWLVLIINQFAWIFWIVCSETWGLIPTNIALLFVGFRNHRKWKKEAGQIKKCNDGLQRVIDMSREMKERNQWVCPRCELWYELDTKSCDECGFGVEE